jgi:hypothetical protein
MVKGQAVLQFFTHFALRSYEALQIVKILSEQSILLHHPARILFQLMFYI